MPAKPIRPDHVRTPRQWWHARILLALGMTIGLAISGVGVTFLRDETDIAIPFWLRLLIIPVFFTPGVVHSIAVKRRWTRIIRDNNGLLCPNCAYVVKGSKEEGTGVRCAECGHFIQDCKSLHERWLKKHHWFFG